jgi:hypothetical protein
MRLNGPHHSPCRRLVSDPSLGRGLRRGHAHLHEKRLWVEPFFRLVSPGNIEAFLFSFQVF